MDLLEGLLWLTLNLYHEGRGEALVGQQAIVHVTMNRSKYRNMSVKEVILQPSQFSWTKKKSYLPKDTITFMKCLNTVVKTLPKEDFTEGADHYHATRVNPSWAKHQKFIAQIGNHKFYKGANHGEKSLKPRNKTHINIGDIVYSQYNYFKFVGQNTVTAQTNTAKL